MVGESYKVLTAMCDDVPDKLENAPPLIEAKGAPPVPITIFVTPEIGMERVNVISTLSVPSVLFGSPIRTLLSSRFFTSK